MIPVWKHFLDNKKHINLFIILLLLILCLASRIVNYVGTGINDDIAYIQNASALAQGYNPISTGFNQLGFRLGMVVPLSLIYKIFGLSDAAFSLYPLICSLITCVLIYLTALRLWGKGAAIFASLLWIAYPLQIVFDTQLSPSNQQATCVAAALFLYLYSTTDSASSPIPRLNSASKWRKPVLLILSGIFLGFGWWLNEIFVTAIIVVIPFFFIMRPKIKHLSWIIAGFIFIVLLELLIVKIATGSWLARFSCILKTEAAVVSNKNYEYLPRTFFKLSNINHVSDEGHFGIIWYLFIIASILTFFMKQKLPKALALGCWLWVGYIQWGVQSPEGTPIAKYIRYMSMIVPLQCIIFGAILGHFTKLLPKLKPAIIFLFVLLLIHLFWFGAKAVNIIQVYTDDFKEITKFLLNSELRDDDIIYADDLTANFIEVYSKGTLKIQRTNHFKMSSPPANGIFIKDGSRYLFELPEYRAAMPEWFHSAPAADWPLLYTVRGRNIGIYKDFDPKIYRIL